MHSIDTEPITITPSITIPDSDGSNDILYEICISQHDPSATLDPSTSYTPNTSKEFLWYRTDLNGDNEVFLFSTAGGAAGPTFDQLDMGLADVTAGSIRYFEVTQRTDIDDALDGYIGCEGPPIFIQVEFSDLDELTVTMPTSTNGSNTNEYCYDDVRGDFQMVLNEDGTPVGSGNVTYYEVRLAGTSTVIDLDPGAPVVPATGAGYPTVDLDAWLVGGGEILITSEGRLLC